MNLRHFGIALVTFGLVVAMPVAAERVQTTNPGPHAAQISGTPGKVTEDIFPVRIAQINGRNIHPRETLWLEPGRYEFRVQVDIPSGAWARVRASTVFAGAARPLKPGVRP